MLGCGQEVVMIPPSQQYSSDKPKMACPVSCMIVPGREALIVN